MKAGSRKRTILQRGGVTLLPALALACMSPIAPAQTASKPPATQQAQPPAKQQAQPMKPAVHRHGKKAKAEPPPTPAPPVPTVAPSLLEQPATPATVSTSNNELTVKAQNSSLSQILRQVSSQTGMKLDGMSADERVFGNFGPGAPREVLTSLLNGTSYNLIMVGDLPNGAPRELLLSRRSGGAAPPHMPAVAGNPNANPNAGQEEQQNPEENPPEDTGNGDETDEAPPPQYTPPSIEPAEPNATPDGAAPTPRTIPMQPPPQQ